MANGSAAPRRDELHAVMRGCQGSQARFVSTRSHRLVQRLGRGCNQHVQDGAARLHHTLAALRASVTRLAPEGTAMRQGFAGIARRSRPSDGALGPLGALAGVEGE
jgi:hypothetical protein